MIPKRVVLAAEDTIELFDFFGDIILCFGELDQVIIGFMNFDMVVLEYSFLIKTDL